jgi:hypothetical protein
MRSLPPENDQRPIVSQKKSPAEAGDLSDAASTQQQDQDDERNRNSDQPEQNGHVTFLSGHEC